jgi:hypothetical protein
MHYQALMGNEAMFGGIVSVGDSESQANRAERSIDGEDRENEVDPGQS